MELEILEEAKTAKQMPNGCCMSDIWAVGLPE